jgi:hypothetical protein
LGALKYILYNYDKVKMFNMPVKEHILVFSTESDVSTEDIINKVSHPPSNIINKDKKDTLRNLYESSIPEEMIADQLDLDVSTVRTLIKEGIHVLYINL